MGVPLGIIVQFIFPYNLWKKKIFPPVFKFIDGSSIMDEIQKNWFIAAGRRPAVKSATSEKGVRLLQNGLQNVSGRGHRTGRGRRPSYHTRVLRGISKQIDAEVIREARIALLGATWRHSARREATFALLSGRQTTFQLRQQHLYTDDIISIDSGTDSDVGSDSRHRPATEAFPIWNQEKPLLSPNGQPERSSFDTMAFAAMRELDLADTGNENVLKEIAKQLKHFAQTLPHVQTSSLNSNESNSETKCREQNDDAFTQFKPPSIGARRTAAYRTHAMKWLYCLTEGRSGNEGNEGAPDESIARELFLKSDKESRVASRTFSSDAEACEFLTCNVLPTSLTPVIQEAAKKETQLLLELMRHPEESVAKTLIHKHGGAWNVVRAQLHDSDMVAVHDSEEGRIIPEIVVRLVAETFDNSQDLQYVSFPEFVDRVSIHAMRPTQDEILQAFRYARDVTYGFQVVWRMLNFICGITNVHQRDAVSVTANLLKESESYALKQKDRSVTDTAPENEVEALRRFGSMTASEIRRCSEHLSLDDAVLVKQFAMAFVLHDPKLRSVG